MKKLIPIIALVLIAVAAGAVAAETGSTGVVNVNTASSNDLQLLPRVGPALAGRILEFREANGPFAAVDELIAVKGIGETSLEKLRPFVAVSGQTTLAEKVKLPRTAKTNAS